MVGNNGINIQKENSAEYTMGTMVSTQRRKLRWREKFLIPKVVFITEAHYALKKSWAGFSNDLWDTLSYGELLKHVFYLIVRNFGWVIYSNNFIKYLYNRARCILIYNFLELGEISVSKVRREIRSSVNRLRIWPYGHVSQRT